MKGTLGLAIAAFGAWLGTAGAAAAATSGPDIQTWETDNGVPVLFVSADAVPMVDVKLVFDAGSAREDGPEGVAQLTSRLLEAGTDELDEDAVAREFESLGARFSTGSGRERGSVSLRSLSDPDHLEPAVKLMADVVTAPAFPEAAFERERRRMQVNLRRELQSPGGVASRAFMEAVYGDHPYGRHPDGTQESLGDIEREAVIDFHERYYTAANALIAIVGDLDRERAEALAEEAVAGLPEGEAPAALPEASGTAEHEEQRHTFPANQSHVMFGQPAIARDDPDYYALTVGNHALGGSGLTSILTREVRNKRGLSYHASSSFVPLRARGPFLVNLQTANAQVDEALEVARETIAEYRAEGPSEDDLELARENLIGGFPMRIDTNSEILDELITIGFHDLPLDTLDRYTEEVEAVDQEMIRDAFQRHLDPETFASVVVGGEAE